MAGLLPGAPAPLPAAQPAAPLRTLHVVAPAPTTRTRRNHGTFMLGGHLAGVYSTRRAGVCYGVSFELGAETLKLSSSMTPAQARALARALTAAAAASDATAHIATKGGAA